MITSIRVPRGYGPFFGAAAVLAATIAVWPAHAERLSNPGDAAERRTVEDVLALYGPAARRRIQQRFERAHVDYPPPAVTLLGLKDTAKLELWVDAEPWPVHVTTYAIQALSGVAGPKLAEGDRQVPEGIYAIEALNPNSNFHLSLKLNFPNEFDLRQALKEGRTDPGSNIFIHGKASSEGCLAMDDEVIEELFVLAAEIGESNLSVKIAPTDPRIKPLTPSALHASRHEWIADLYAQISAEFRKYQAARRGRTAM